MGMFDGKKGLVLGVANDRSIAWAIAKTIMDEGGEIGFTHLPDRPDDEKQKNRRRVTKCTDQYPDQTKFVVPMNVQDDGDIASVMETAKQEFGEIDFLLHSIAFADRDDLSRDTVETSRDGFKMAMEISAYSLIAVANAAKDIIKENGVGGLFRGIVPRIGLGIWQTLFMVTGAKILKEELKERGLLEGSSSSGGH